MQDINQSVDDWKWKMNEICLLALNRSVFIRSEWIFGYWILNLSWYVWYEPDSVRFSFVAVIWMNEFIRKLINIYLHSLSLSLDPSETHGSNHYLIWTNFKSRDGFFIISRLRNHCVVFHIVVSILQWWA